MNGILLEEKRLLYEELYECILIWDNFINAYPDPSKISQLIPLTNFKLYYDIIGFDDKMLPIISSSTKGKRLIEDWEKRHGKKFKIDEVE